MKYTLSVLALLLATGAQAPPRPAQGGGLRSIEIEGHLVRPIVNQGRLIDPCYLERDIGLWLAGREGAASAMVEIKQ